MTRKNALTREEAAAKAHYESGEFSEKWEMSQPAIRQWNLARMTEGVAAADAYDAAHGIHRIKIDDGTVERAARALHDRMRSQAACSCCFTAWEDASERTRESYRDDARAVLAAAVEAGQ